MTPSRRADEAAENASKCVNGYVNQMAFAFAQFHQFMTRKIYSFKSEKCFSCYHSSVCGTSSRVIQIP